MFVWQTYTLIYYTILMIFLFSTDCLVLYVTWRLFVFSNQFDLNIFMKTTENSSIFRLLTTESMLFNISNILNRKEVVKEIPPYLKNQSVPIVFYSYTIQYNKLYLKSENIKHYNTSSNELLNPTLTALAVKFSTTKKHCKILT